MGARRIRPPHDPEAEERVRKLNRRGKWLTEPRSYFRFPDGRLGSIGYFGGVHVELDDPTTAQHYYDEIRNTFGRYELKNGKLVLTAEGRQLEEQERLEKEFEKTQPPKWYSADEFEPDRTGTYRCIVKKGWFRRKREETDVYFKSGAFCGDWLTGFGERVIEWRENK